MNVLAQENVTLILEDCINGNKQSIDQLLPHIYMELKNISAKYLRNEYRNHTLQTTELVHEAYIKMVGSKNVNLQNRTHFFGMAAQSMRQILVDHARKRNAKKRGEGKENLPINKVLEISEKSDQQIIELDDALKKLQIVEERSSRIIELRFFTGLTIDETAQVNNPHTSNSNCFFNQVIPNFLSDVRILKRFNVIRVDNYGTFKKIIRFLIGVNKGLNLFNDFHIIAMPGQKIIPFIYRKS